MINDLLSVGQNIHIYVVTREPIIDLVNDKNPSDKS